MSLSDCLRPKRRGSAMLHDDLADPRGDGNTTQSSNRLMADPEGGSAPANGFVLSDEPYSPDTDGAGNAKPKIGSPEWFA